MYDAPAIVVIQEVRGEKDAIEQRIDDLAQDAAGVSLALLNWQAFNFRLCACGTLQTLP